MPRTTRRGPTRKKQEACLKLYEKHNDWGEVVAVLREAGDGAVTKSTAALAASRARRRRDGERRRTGNLTDKVVLECATRLAADTGADINDLVFELTVSAAKLNQIQHLIVDGLEWEFSSPKPGWANYMRERFLKEPVKREGHEPVAPTATNADRRVEGEMAPVERDEEDLQKAARARQRAALCELVAKAVRAELEAFAEKYDVCVEKRQDT